MGQGLPTDMAAVVVTAELLSLTTARNSARIRTTAQTTTAERLRTLGSALAASSIFPAMLMASTALMTSLRQVLTQLATLASPPALGCAALAGASLRGARWTT